MNQRAEPCIATALAAAWPPSPKAILLVCSPACLIFFPPQPITSADEDGRAPHAPRCSRQVCCCGVQSGSQPWLLRRKWPGVPRWGDGATAPRGSTVDLASAPCSGGKKGSLCLWFVAWEGGCDQRDLGAGWWLFVKCSEIPMWKEIPM